MPKIIDLAHQLAAGAVTSRDLVERCLDRIADPAGEGERAFLNVYGERARREADAADAARKNGWQVSPFHGIPMSIKDLFDVAGEVTRAGSHVLDDQPPARSDSDLVGHLRRAGFVLLGKTNMTEFAYSGLGINAHFGTPLSPYDRGTGRIPGGSTSGGAVSVADGMAVATIGTDTGGSCRIPAAFCGIAGFKPTSTRVSKRGVVPLSSSMDSVGPLAHSVSCCSVLDSVITGGTGVVEPAHDAGGLRIGVLEGYTTEILDAETAASWEQALRRLEDRGARLVRLDIAEFRELPTINRNGGLVGAEAWALHRKWIETRSAYYDPWILMRFDAGKAQSAADYIDVLHHRERVVASVRKQTAQFDVLALPTVQIKPPVLSDMDDLKVSNATNHMCLRNTAIGNFLDRPSISIPCHAEGDAPAGFMLMGRRGHDRKLFSIAAGVEEIVRLT